MVEFQVPINRKQRLAYIPKVLVEALGHDLTILPNTRAALMYPAGAPLNEVLESLQIIQRHLELKMKGGRSIR